MAERDPRYFKVYQDGDDRELEQKIQQIVESGAAPGIDTVAREGVEEIQRMIENGEIGGGGGGAGVDNVARQEIQEVAEALADTVKEVNGVKPVNGKITLPISGADTTNLATKTEVNSVSNEVARIIAHNGDGTKDTEVVEARNIETTIGKRLKKMEDFKRIDFTQSAQLKYGAERYINPAVELGMLYSSGATTQETNRYRSKEFFKPKGDMTVFINNPDFRYILYSYNMDGSFVGDNGFWQTGASKKIPFNNAHKYKIVIARNDDAVFNIDDGLDSITITDGVFNTFLTVIRPHTWWFAHGSSYPNFNTKKHLLEINTEFTDVGIIYENKRYQIVPDAGKIQLDISAAATGNSSLGIIVYNYSTNKLEIKQYGFIETISPNHTYILLGTFRRTNNSYNVSMSCPFTVDGELFKKGGSKSTELDFITATAHRGYSGTAPENTLPAFVLAKKLGYSRVETDVAWTKDDVPVLLHDTTIDRTSDGTGAVLDYTYEELLQFDFGTWKSPDYAGTKIMRFDDFIVMCKKLSIYPHIELKLIESTEHIETLIRIVKRKGMIDNVSWDSFHYDNLVKVKEVYPKASLAYIIDREFTDVMLSNAVSLKTDNNIVMINLFSTYLTETVSNKILDNDLKLCAWSVWSNATVQELAKLGVTNFSVDSLNVAQALYDEFI